MKPYIDVTMELGKEGHTMNILALAVYKLRQEGKESDIVTMRTLFHHTTNVWDGFAVINDFVTLSWNGKTLNEYREAVKLKEQVYYTSDRVGGDS